MGRIWPDGADLTERWDRQRMIVGILMAAGTSSRYGDDDKLLQSVGGQRLVEHVADAIRAIELDARIVIARSMEVAAHLPDFKVVDVSATAPHMAGSLKARDDPWCR